MFSAENAKKAVSESVKPPPDSSSEEEEEEPQLSMAGKDMRKLVKKLEKNLAYDESDDDKNPYASSVSYHRWMLNSSSLT